MNDELEIKVWPPIFRAIGPGDDMVVSAEKLEAYISKNFIKKEDVLEAIETNQKGQFEDDAGHICWYLDDLVSAIKKLNIGENNG